eukprot:COSAG01_NODE_2397_length_7771_cov_12.578076_4_plen_115_part_00
MAPTVIPMLLFSGYLIPYAQIPSYFKWLYDISFFQCDTPLQKQSLLIVPSDSTLSHSLGVVCMHCRYALGLVQINQFAGMQFTDCPPKLETTNKNHKIDPSSLFNTSSMTPVGA